MSAPMSRTWSKRSTSLEVPHAQQLGDDRVASRSPPEAQVDAAGRDRFEGGELLRDDEGRMVRQHHAAGADPDARRACGGGGDQHGRGGRRDSRHVVVLREPVAAVAQIIGALCQSQRGGDRLRAGLAGTDGNEVENRERGRHRRRQPRDRPPHSAAGIHRAFLTAS
jgi:hypothetical protein